MAHQTGIPPSPQLLDSFKQAAAVGSSASSASQQLYSLQIQLTGDQAVPSRTINWQPGVDESVVFRKTKELLIETEPCFLLLRCNGNNSTNQGWAFLSHIPQTAPVRQKMIYAATRTSLLQQLNGILNPGQLLLNTQLQAKEDFSKEWLKQEIAHSTAVGHEAEKLRELVMDDKEKALKEMRLSASRNDHGTMSKQSHAASLQFPWTPEAKQMLHAEYPQQKRYLTFKLEGEKVHYCTTSGAVTSKGSEAGGVLAAASKFGGVRRPSAAASVPSNSEPVEERLVSALKESLPKEEPRYVLIRFPPESPSATHLFVYVCPASSPVQQKMIYASARTPFYNELLATLKTIDGDAVQCKRVEIGDLEDLTVEFLCDLVGCPVPAKKLESIARSNDGLADGAKKEDAAQHGFVKKIAAPGSGGRRLVGRI